MGIARDDDDILYVAGGGSNNIVKFDTSGMFLGEIKHEDLSGPQGVAFDQNGHLFSSSYYKNQIVVFDANGDYVQTIAGGNLNVPRSIAFEQILEPTSVENMLVLHDFKLCQNYPNPFNPSTSIEYTIPNKSNVTIKVYNILGSDVKTLVNGIKNKGSYKITFDAVHLTSGIYFYSLQAGEFKETKKMTILK